MSYSFQVRKHEGTLQFVHPETLEQVAKYLPDGAVLTVNGHTPSDDTSAVAAIGITLSTAREDGGGYEFIGQATGNFTTKR